MLWRKTKTVAFGIKGPYVAAWYCDPSGTTNSNGAGVDSAKLADTFKANVYSSDCLEVTRPDLAKPYRIYYKCFNERELDAHNTKRSTH